SESPSVPKVIVEKEKIEKEQPLPPEVKIKLKKDGKDSYSLTPVNFAYNSKPLQSPLFPVVILGTVT
ncbi:MAG: hypothetical protein ABSH06_23705, partial [Thermodesulfobacteriota bacterium]